MRIFCLFSLSSILPINGFVNQIKPKSLSTLPCINASSENGLKKSCLPTIAYRPKVSFIKKEKSANNYSQRSSGYKNSSLRMVSYDELLEKLPSKSVIEAVESTSGKVVASDVAAKAGVSLSQARKDLTALASLTQGDISVTTDGELIYNFPKNLNSALSSSSFKYKLVQLGRKAWPPLFYAIRVSFGVALLVSIFAIFSTIAFISASSSSSDDRDRRDRGGGSMFYGGNLFGPSPFDFFYYRPYYGYYGSPYYKDPEEMGFLESTFSYIFGDGNPNQDIEERRLRLVSNMIRMNNGAVTAEQLAPFVVEDDIPKPDASLDDPNSIRYVDESFVLPIVTQLGGEPVVTEDGDIVYVFPEMQLSAQSNAGLVLQKFGLSENSPSRDIKSLLAQAGIDTGGALEKRDLLQIFDKNSDLFLSAFGELEDENLLEEREYEFSVASDTNKFLAGGLGVVNLGGALYLGNILGQAASLGVRLPSYYGVVQSFFPALLGYAILYNTIPIARNFWIKKENKKIRQRNRNRQLWKNIASSSVGRVKRKLKQAKSMGSRLKQLGASKDSVVFDTSDSMEDVNIKSEKSKLDDFDRLLGKE